MPTKSKNEECYNIKFYKLWDMLNRRGMKKTDLLQVISSPTLAKLAKSESITTEVIGKICKFLDCQPGDLMEYEPSEKEEIKKGQVIKSYPLSFPLYAILYIIYSNFTVNTAVPVYAPALAPGLI